LKADSRWAVLLIACLIAANLVLSAAPVAHAPLSFKTQPKKLTVTTGDSATFSVQVMGGTPPYTYTWTNSGTPDPGTKGATYTISGITMENDNAFITVEVKDSSNEKAPIISNTAVLTVFEPAKPWLTVPDGTEGNPFVIQFLLGEENSNLYRQSATSGFFSGSKGMAEMDLTYRWPRVLGGFVKHDLDIGLRGAFSGTGPSDTQTIVTSSQNFFTTLDLALLWKQGDRFAIGPQIGVTWADYPQAPASPSTGSSPGDLIRSIVAAGIATESAFGAGSNIAGRAGVFLQNDPLYAQPHRLDAIGRLTYHATAGNLFLEGELNKGLGSSQPNNQRLSMDVGSIRFGIEFDPFTSLATLFSKKAS
jgi:hypothetical protein